MIGNPCNSWQRGGVKRLQSGWNEEDNSSFSKAAVNAAPDLPATGWCTLSLACYVFLILPQLHHFIDKIFVYNMTTNCSAYLSQVSGP